MTIPKKQLKITKLFKRGATIRIPDDCDELQEEVRQLERRLREKQDELFQIQRNSYRCKASPVKKKDDDFVRPQKIILNNSIESLKRSLELMSMLTSTEVQSYVAGRNEVSACSLPLGFNLQSVMEDFDNIMKPDCLGAIRKALVAYYDRLEQFQNLKKLVNVGAELFKTLDGSHVEISMFVQSVDDGDDEDPFPVKLMLDYRVYDIRPKNIVIEVVNPDSPEDAQRCLEEQCSEIKKKPIDQAFDEAFIEVGPYKMVKQTGPLPASERVRHRAVRRNKHGYNDDTFQPDDCSDPGDDDEDVQ